MHISEMNPWKVEIHDLALLYAQSLCNLNSFGRIKNDDKLIQSEGVDLLSTPELQAACRDRGILGILTEEEMRKQVVKIS